jgi:diaminohydroxyphosphoribosylaminopyrimidine deaminase/5-amino-6-(5-phosphoribosylamino)uracil reductase
MRRALELARRAVGRTSPNPLVGAIVARGDQVLGEGWHAAAGAAHAEFAALAAAGPEAAGATLYTTLEPCNHHGRTPPCTEAIRRARIRRVVSAMEDPDSRVQGAGHERLRRGGIDVVVGTLGAEAAALNAPYVKHRRTGRPLVTLKWAMSLDGKLATRTGSSQWITSEAARAEGHRLRNTHDAVLVGLGTARRDDPALTCRIPEGRDPLRIVLDSGLRFSETWRMLRTGQQAPLIVGTKAASEADRARLEHAGAEVMICEADAAGHVDLSALLDHLGGRGVLSLLVEGGAEVHASFLADGLADRIQAFVAPVLIGGVQAPGPVGGLGVASVDAALRVKNPQHRTVGPDIVVSGEIEGRLEAAACSPG